MNNSIETRLQKKLNILSGLPLEFKSCDMTSPADLDAFERRLRETRSLIESMMDDVYAAKTNLKSKPEDCGCRGRYHDSACNKAEGK